MLELALFILAVFAGLLGFGAWILVAVLVSTAAVVVGRPVRDEQTD